ncbi:MAG: hypothetical protein KC656_19635 [Myxococcales bacterium]|nr:hypothetical protein [Myxococcales bacterium]MCB9671722.1 hypothetical protein [Alphaproteobacteria bacterium]
MTESLLAFLSTLSTGTVLPVPEEGVLLGIAATHPESAGLVAVGVASFLGLAVRDFTLFLLGRTVGRQVFRWPLLRRIVGDAPVASLSDGAAQNAVRSIVAARMAFGVKAAAQVTLGAVGVPVSTHLIVNALVLAVWVPLWLALGAWFHGPAVAFLAWMSANKGLMAAMLAIVAAAWVTQRMAEAHDAEEAESTGNSARTASSASASSGLLSGR